MKRKIRPLTLLTACLTSKEGKGMAHYHSILEVREDIKAHIGDSEITDENLLKWQNGNDMDEDSSNDPRGIRIK